MSYCRWSDCDLYIYADCDGGWTIHDTHGGDYNLPSPGECADKVEELQKLGRHVSNWVIPELRAEQADLDTPPPPAGADDGIA